MLKYLNRLPNEYEEMLNRDLMEKRFDRPLEEYMFQAFKGFEILPNIKILGYDWVPDEEKFDINDHVIRRNSNKNKAIKNISETRCGVMYIDVEVSGLDKAGNLKVHYLKKPLVLPIQDEHGYLMIKGKKCYLIYQLVDKMLYPSFGAVTIKSLMPICVKTTKDEFIGDNGETYTIPCYTIQIFRTPINVLMIYSHLGVSKMLNFLELNRFVWVESKEKPYVQDPSIIRFDCGKKSELRVAVWKEIFDQDIYVRSMVGCLINLLVETKITYNKLDDWDTWMMLVGGKNTIRRGIYQHIFFNRLLDDVTACELKIPDHDKQNIYYLLRWVLQNFHVLWSKDNLSMINKRIRCNEYLSTLMTLEISKKINWIVSLGDKAGIAEYMKLFRFPEDLFITKLYVSGVLRYVETDSDIDFAQRFKFTSKGPNSLGNRDSRRIPTRQRTLHPSMLGYVDIAETSSTDPGRSGSLSPYCKMDSMYFDDSLYESEVHYRIAKYLDEHPLGGDYEELVIKCENDKEYNATLDALFHAGQGKFQMYGVSHNPMEIIVERDPREGYRKFNEDAFLSSGEGVTK